MKKLLALTLNFIFCISCLVIPSGVNAYYDSTTDLEIAVGLGVLDADAMGRGDDIITRGEFVYGLINLIGSEMAVDYSSFSDVTSQTQYAQSIYGAHAYGFISGYGDGTFRPLESLDVTTGARLLCYALGYQDFLQQGFSLTKACTDSGICSAGDSVSTSALTVKKAAELFVNTANALTVVPDSIQSGTITYKFSNKTLLDANRGIIHIEGVVCANEFTYIDQHNNLDNGYVMIGSTLMRVGTTDAKNLLGHNVVAYYKKGSTEKNNELLYVKSYDNNIIRVSAENIASYEKTTKEFTYYNSEDKTKTVSLSLFDTNIIYNNRLLLSPSESDFNIGSGSVSLIDNNGDKSYDVVVVESYETYVIDTVDIAGKKVFSKWGKGVLDFNDDSKVTFESEDGQEMHLVELHQWDVLDVYASKDGEYKRVIYPYGWVEGTIGEVSTGGIPFAVIGSDKYLLTDDFVTHQLNDTIGMEAVFSLDSHGRIASANANSKKGLNYGYIIKASTPSGLDPQISIKYLTSDSEVLIKELAAKVKLNGKTLAVNSNIDKFASLQETVVLYRLNSDGKISYIDTPYKLNDDGTTANLESEESVNSLCEYATATDLQYRSATGVFGGKIAVDQNTLVFRVSSDPDRASDDEYDVIKISQFVSNDDKRTFKAYRSSEKVLCAEAIVKKENYNSRPNVSEDTVVSVVESISKIMNEDGNQVYKLKAFTNGKLATYITEDLSIVDSIKNNGSHYTIQAGDIVRIVNNVKGVTRNIVPVYVHSADGSMQMADGGANPSSSSFIQRYRVQAAYVYQTSNNHFCTTTTPLEIGKTYLPSELSYYELRTFTGYSIVVCDSEKEEVTAGTASNIIGFLNSGSNECSKVFIYDRYGDSMALVIYK